MADVRRPAFIGVAVLGLLFAVLMLRNISANDQEVIDLAKEAACGGRMCSTTLAIEEHSAFSRAYQFRMEGDKTVQVSCSRGLFFLGSFQCSIAQP